MRSKASAIINFIVVLSMILASAPTIVSAATNLTLSLPQGRHWPAIGAAILAGVGAGLFDDITDGLGRFQRPERTIEPDPEAAAIYSERFATYQQVAQLLAEHRED